MESRVIGGFSLGAGCGVAAWLLLRALAAAVEPGLAAPAPSAAPASSRDKAADWTPPGDGFVVWESNRTGRWRLWIRDLERRPSRQLTGDEGRRAHCCPHISPDGRWIAYLSLEPGPDEYPEGPEQGELRLIDRDGRPGPELGLVARSYGEHRAAVWRSASRLVFLDEQGRTAERDLETGTTTILLPTPHPRWGYLPSPDLAHATTGEPSFARLRPDGTLPPSRIFGGCQPYFSPDSRWGYWTAGAGGPIDRLELATGRVGTILDKHDRRLPEGQGYLYFPMLSPSGSLLAVGASRDEHSHFSADYDIFVGEVDPQRLEVLGPLVRFTDDPATDRFPAVFAAPLPLGVYDGESPLRLTLEAPDGAAGWSWQLGDGGTAQGSRVEHVWQEPGSYRVLARRAGEELEGRVRVAPRRPPEVLAAEVREGVVEVVFDEPVAIDRLRATLSPGGELDGAALDEAGRTLSLHPAEPLTGNVVLVLEGITDRGLAPAALGRQELALAPRSWPSDQRGLLFLWRDGEADNRLRSRDGVEQSFSLTAHGAARYDRQWRMLLDRGQLEAAPAAAVAVAEGARARNGITLELVALPDRPQQAAALVALGGSRGRRRLFVLEQLGERLQLAFVSARSGPQLNVVDLGAIPADRPSHWVIGYRPGRLTAYRDGEQLVQTEEVQGGLFHWRGRSLTFGREGDGTPWAGRLEGIAFYDRVLDAAEARENAARLRRRLDARSELPVMARRSRVVARSHTPTLAEISPYSQALSVFEVEGEGGAAAGAERARVALYTVLDGRPTAHGRRAVGSVLDLELQPFAAQPQLAGLVLIDDLPPRPDLPLLFDVGPP